MQEQKLLKNAVPDIISNMVKIPESSEHQGLYIGKYEVTQAQWQSVMGNNPSHFKGDLNRPVERVSWDGCQKFLERLNALPEVKRSGLVFRLPTEQEWEYACRAGSKGKYGLLADGTEGSLDEMGWYFDNSGKKTHPVGQKKPNAWGLYDMHGNVWEWTSSESYDYRIYRGGSWDNYAEYCGSDSRSNDNPDNKNNDLGFRLAAKKAEFLKAEAERIAREKAEAERIAREKAEAERIAREKAEAERIAREKAEAERIAREKAEAERIAREKAEAELISNMVRIPESSEHQGLYIGKYEVTQAQWQAVMGNNPSKFTGDLSRPVERVSWYECLEFINKLNALPEVKKSGLFFRLPTKEEWDYACRAGSKGLYGLLANGREGTLDEMGWYRDNSGRKTHPVGQKKPNAWGLYDMHGNVWEWTSPEDDGYCIFRGGGWSDSARYCVSYGFYHGCKPDNRFSSLGFRLVASRTGK